MVLLGVGYFFRDKVMGLNDSKAQRVAATI
jgi:hypothetical protein